MAQEYKYFISKLDAQRDIVKLRKLFPNHYYKDGMKKDTKGVFIIRETKNREYGEQRNSVLRNKLVKEGLLTEDQHVTFWAPSCSKDEFDYSKYEIDTGRPKISVTLTNGKVVNINPAAGEPKEMIFGGDYEEERIQMASLYSRATEYGELAYQLIYAEDEVQEQGGLLSNDKRLLKLIELAMVNSYSLPLDMFNWLNLVSQNDVGLLYKAAMGADQSFLEALVGGS